MEWRTINFALDYLASTGTCFSVESRVAIQASLLGLQKDNHFKNVYFWGKIHGTDNDYLIVCGMGKDYLRDRTYFYSIDNGQKWILLQAPTPKILELGLACKGRFVGDPGADSETEIPPNDLDTIEEGEQWEYIKEEERLSATVAVINSEAAIVPRGALIKNPNGLVYENKTFEGLSREDALQLISYFHLRRPDNPWDKNIVGRPDYNLTLDFLDSISNDLPIGCWTISLDRLESMVTIRSLYWPGAFGFHCLSSNGYGWFYCGTGKKNWDVPFMILPPSNLTKASIVESSSNQRQMTFDHGEEEDEEEEGLGEEDEYFDYNRGRSSLLKTIQDPVEAENFNYI